MASLHAPPTPAPDAPDLSGPVGLELRASTWSSWQHRIEDDKKNHAMAKRINAAIAALEIPAPPGHKFTTLRYLFKWDKHDKWWTLKSYDGVKGNIISIEDFMEMPAIKELIEDPAVCDSITYYDEHGTEIPEAKAFEASKIMDPANKPPSKRPGKRSAPDPNAGPSSGPATPAKGHKAA